MILVDTNVLSEITKPRPTPQVAKWLRENEHLLAMPAVALGELRYGIARMPIGRKRSKLLQFWETTCEHFRDRIFSFDKLAAEAYGDILAEAERRGQRLNIADGQIAAIARVHGMDIATRNVKDFAASGVPLVNPWD